MGRKVVGLNPGAVEGYFFMKTLLNTTLQAFNVLHVRDVECIEILFYKRKMHSALKG